VSLYFHADRILKQQKSCALFRAEVLHEAEKQILDLYEDTDLNEIPSLTHERNTVWYEQTLIPLLQALESKKKETLILCVQNNGSIRDLPDECSVEVSVEVSNKSITPRHVGDSPHFLKGLFQTVKESDRWLVEAVLHKSYEYALQALTINPLVPSLETARTYLDKVVQTEHLELH
jgi:6-phospho-beta-glucosidase